MIKFVKSNNFFSTIRTIIIQAIDCRNNLWYIARMVLTFLFVKMKVFAVLLIFWYGTSGSRDNQRVYEDVFGSMNPGSRRLDEMGIPETPEEINEYLTDVLSRMLEKSQFRTMNQDDILNTKKFRTSWRIYQVFFNKKNDVG